MKTIKLKHGECLLVPCVFHENIQVPFLQNKYVEEKTLRNWFDNQFPKKQLTRILIRHLFASHHGNIVRGLKPESIRLICGGKRNWAISWEWNG